ncbi:SMP-30/gluconolactonase/LRE family protein [Aquibacillus sediminis]|uniref:SMP-30/gluconolactonase/LRE family protein n=1 Tax=Aquibacillus sediminis TaxID=2574734 RepID=UPI001107CF91|nr:SMP-30/gluconolactonase/LRE family protein [Aquibacillus sediminis]
MKAQVFGSMKSTFGEGPLWDHETASLFWVDLAEKKILSYNFRTKEETSYQLPEIVTAVVKYSKSQFILFMIDGFYLYDLKKQTITELWKPEGLNEKFLLNDGKCDPQGRLWAGSVNDDFKKIKEADRPPSMELLERKAFLYRIDENLSIRSVRNNITVSNGMDWDPVRNRMYYVDSATQSIFQYDFEPDTGTIKNEQVVYIFEELEGFPDGMTIDQEGMLWVALFKSGKIAQKTSKHGVIAKINPMTNKWVDCITVPTSHVTSCTFGGEDLKTLFITTAIEPLSEYERGHQPEAGRLFSIDLDVGGYEVNRFKGDLSLF